MKIIRYGIAFAAVLALVITQFSLISSASAHASSIYGKTLVSVTTRPLYVNCKQHPSAAILKNWAKYNICGYGKRSSSIVTPNGVSGGDCGTVTNAVYNDGGGVAESVVTIAPSWYSGGMYKAYYTGPYSSTSGISGGFGNIKGFAPLVSFYWSDPKYYYTDTGTATFTVNSEAAATITLGECTLVNTISASANITA